ncbi:CU044_2847 family protein [Streptomyces sp. NRRL B-1347]|uniref:CU044_2847 family protein n=1 Tax=Streptomyces sp. NRRL B-1347 TaxID=1476877 RepID=UPI0004C62A23|nr:CU044_2847 family protein [Streptomyces sp. NRRL B-1347]
MNEDELSRDVVRAVLPDGTELLITASRGRGPVERAGRVFGLGGVQRSIHGVMDLVRGSVRQAQPDELTVSFGLDVAVDGSGLIGLVTGAGGKATFTVTALWRAKAGAAEPGNAGGDGAPTTEEGSAGDTPAG